MLGFSAIAEVALAEIPSSLPQTLTSTGVLQLPINCVIAGDQPEEKKSRFITDFAGILKNIFGES